MRKTYKIKSEDLIELCNYCIVALEQTNIDVREEKLDVFWLKCKAKCAAAHDMPSTIIRFFTNERRFSETSYLAEWSIKDLCTILYHLCNVEVKDE